MAIQFKTSGQYDSISKSIATATTDYDWKTTGGGFDNSVKSNFVSIRSDKAITIKLNSTSNDAIGIDAGEPFEINSEIFITNIYVSNASGDTAVVRIFNT